MHGKMTGRDRKSPGFQSYSAKYNSRKSGLKHILSLGGETACAGVMACASAVCCRQQEENHTIAASSPSIIQPLKLLLQCGDGMYVLPPVNLVLDN